MSNDQKRLAIVWHSRTGTAEAMARAVANGAGQVGELIPAQEATSDLLLSFDGYIFACPENLASMSGAMKEMFDLNYYDLIDKIEGRPFTYVIAGGSDGAGTQRQIERICTGWRLRIVADPIIYLTGAQTGETIWAPKTVNDEVLTQCTDLGQAFSEGLSLGIY